MVAPLPPTGRSHEQQSRHLVGQTVPKGTDSQWTLSVYSVEMLWVLLKNQSSHSQWHMFTFPARVSCSRVWTVIDDLHVYKRVG